MSTKQQAGSVRLGQASRWQLGWCAELQKEQQINHQPPSNPPQAHPAPAWVAWPRQLHEKEKEKKKNDIEGMWKYKEKI